MQATIVSPSEAEVEVLKLFRVYRVGACEMLFFNPQSTGKLQPARFDRAIQALMARGWVNKERPRHAYSLTQQGYRASLSAS